MIGGWGHDGAAEERGYISGGDGEPRGWEEDERPQGKRLTE